MDARIEPRPARASARFVSAPAGRRARDLRILVADEGSRCFARGVSLFWKLTSRTSLVGRVTRSWVLFTRFATVQARARPLGTRASARRPSYRASILAPSHALHRGALAALPLPQRGVRPRARRWLRHARHARRDGGRAAHRVSRGAARCVAGRPTDDGGLRDGVPAARTTVPARGPGARRASHRGGRHVVGAPHRVTAHGPYGGRGATNLRARALGPAVAAAGRDRSAYDWSPWSWSPWSWSPWSWRRGGHPALACFVLARGRAFLSHAIAPLALTAG
jgi:hypothetical protein